jgi:hypothetical protein
MGQSVLLANGSEPDVFDAFDKEELVLIVVQGLEKRGDAKT